MRVKCPGCGAIYEVDSALLPAEGRELQCSGCGHIWFQTTDGGPEQPAPQQVPAAEPEVKNTENPVSKSEPDGDTDDDTPDGLEAEPASATLNPMDGVAPGARGLDSAVSDILRQEAEFEAQARSRERAQIETQPELGLVTQAQWPSRLAQDDATRATDASDDAAGEIEEATLDRKTARNDPFPDIEDLSSTLEPVSAKRQAAGKEFALPQTEQAQRSGFMRGLLLVLILAAVLVALYVTAPDLAVWVPALDTALAGYVALVDRIWLALHALN